MLGNYIIVRVLRGRPAFNAEPATDTPQTFKDIVRNTFYLRPVDAGLIEAKVTPFEPAKESDEEETAWTFHNFR